MLDATAASMPTGGRPRDARTCTTPATVRPHAGTTAAGSSPPRAIDLDGAPRRPEWTTDACGVARSVRDVDLAVDRIGSTTLLVIGVIADEVHPAGRAPHPCRCPDGVGQPADALLNGRARLTR